MRTFNHSKYTDSLGRYYTEDYVSRLLVDLLPFNNNCSLLDLGAGEGALSIAASSKWRGLDLTTVDVDNAASRVLFNNLSQNGFFGKHQHIHRDALGVDLKDFLNNDLNRFPELAVCNPPFQISKWRHEFGSIVEDAGFSGALPAITTTDAAILFLSQNLRMIEAGGTIGIIVPDSLVSASKYLKFRKTLLEIYDLKQVIRLPRRSFTGTDALAHILIISKNNPVSDKVILSLLPSKNGIIRSMSINRSEAAKRLDYLYHFSEKTGGAEFPTLRDVIVDLRRGSFNSAQIRERNEFILHTTDIDISMRGNWVDFEKNGNKKCDYNANYVVADSGDILVARVGRNAADKVIGVMNGKVAISDCIFRVRVLPAYRQAVMDALASSDGLEWLKSHAYGVAARHLSKEDILNLPIKKT